MNRSDRIFFLCIFACLTIFALITLPMLVWMVMLSRSNFESCFLLAICAVVIAYVAYSCACKTWQQLRAIIGNN